MNIAHRYRIDPRHKPNRRMRWLMFCATVVSIGFIVAAVLASETSSPPLMSIQIIGDPSSDRMTNSSDSSSLEDGSSAHAVIANNNEVEQELMKISKVRWFNGRPIRPLRTLHMRVTAYSPDARSCGIFADGITASGYSVRTNGGHLVAADTSMLSFGTKISIPGYDFGEVVTVLDRGGAIKGNRLDVLFPTHEQALAWGVHDLDVIIWEYADDLPDDFESIY